jgi:hypothetical protein
MRDRLPLVTIIGLAVALRVWGIDFGLPHTFARPDEDATVSIALRFFQREFHPGFFHWPTLFMTAVAVVYVGFFNVGRQIGWFPLERIFLESAALHPTAHYLVPRFVSMTAGVLTVSTVYRIGLHLFDRATALVAAFFLAVAALHVRDSHFGVTDVAATWLAMVSFLFTVRYGRGGDRRSLMLSALFAGLAASTKYNCGLVVLPAVWVMATQRSPPPDRWTSRIKSLALYTAISMAAFVAGTPFALIDLPSFLTALMEISEHLRGGHAAVAGPAWTVHLTISLRYGLGLPLLVAGVGGLVFYLWRDWRAGVVFAIFPLVYFIAIGAGQTAFARYILPITPFLCLAAAHLVVTGAGVVGRGLARPTAAPAITWAMALLVATPAAWSAIRTDQLLSRTDNRVLAASWIYQNFPNGVTMHQTGAGYGQVQIRTVDPFAVPRFPETLYDEGADVFRNADGSEAPAPDLIVVQESPLTYSIVPDGIRRMVARDYELRATFRALDSSDPALVYDPDDAFYLPLSGFDAVSRPGPNLMIHVRRGIRSPA